MFKSYFFIPANKKRFIEKAKEIDNIDHRVFDLEDSILESDLENSVELISNVKIEKTDWMRIPLFENRIKQIISTSKQIGIDNYVIPKFKGLSDIQRIIDAILSTNSSAKFILLLEDPKSYIDLEKILQKFNQYIQGVSLGIHDFTFETGMENDYRLLRDIRINIMLLAKSYSVEPIDVVSMHLKNDKALEDEIFDGFKCGYRSKFFIHPYQLDVLKTVSFYTKDKIDEYKKVLEYYHEEVKGKEALFSYNDRVYEKMHIEQMEKTIKWGESYYGTNR